MLDEEISHMSVLVVMKTNKNFFREMKKKYSCDPPRTGVATTAATTATYTGGGPLSSLIATITS